MKARRLKAACIGAGYFSQFHFEAWQRLQSVELAAICDLDRDQAERACTQYGVPGCYENVERMLDEVQPDFVDIITRPASHLELVELVAARGTDIICQKPLAPDFATSKRIVEIAEKHSVRFMVHENFRYQPWHREIKRLISEGVLGDRLHTVSCRSRMGDGWQPDAYLGRQPYFREMSRFLVFETGVHFIDTFRFLAGDITGVYADLRQLNNEIAGEDTAFLILEFASGARGSWDASRYHEANIEDARYTFGEFLIEGEAGAIRLDLNGNMTLQLLGQPEREHRYPHERVNFAGDCVFATQHAFAESLLLRTEFETSGTEYLKTLAVQEAVYESARTGTPVRGIGRSR